MKALFYLKSVTLISASIMVDLYNVLTKHNIFQCLCLIVN